MSMQLMDLTIAEIAEACGGVLTLKDATENQKVSGVILDSRKVIQESVFLATVGVRVDGHRFIGEVFMQGACLVITEKTPKQVEEEHGVEPSKWGSYVLVEDSLQALKLLAEYYRSKLTLLRIHPEHEAAVVEMGISDFGEMHRLSKMVRPNICVITNIGQCHLENLKSRDGILKAKTEIFDFMAQNGQVCLNGEDDKLRTVTEVQGRKPHFFGRGGYDNEEVYATDVVSRGLWGSDVLLHMDNESIPVHVPLPGIHMVGNAAAAACVAKLLGLTAEQIGEGISKVAAIGGRNNLIRLPQYTLIDDCYNANPVSMKAALDLLVMADTPKVAILGDMFELGENSAAMHEEVGYYAAKLGVDRIYCVGEQSRQMYEGARREAENNATSSTTEQQTVLHFQTREELLERFDKDRESLLPEGCTVLIKASHGMVFTEILKYLKEQT